MLPNISIERPTAKNVKANLVGFLMLDLIVKPTVEESGSQLRSNLDESLI